MVRGSLLVLGILGLLAGQSLHAQELVISPETVNMISFTEAVVRTSHALHTEIGITRNNLYTINMNPATRSGKIPPMIMPDPRLCQVIGVQAAEVVNRFLIPGPTDLKPSLPQDYMVWKRSLEFSNRADQLNERFNNLRMYPLDPAARATFLQSKANMVAALRVVIQTTHAYIQVLEQPPLVLMPTNAPQFPERMAALKRSLIDVERLIEDPIVRACPGPVVAGGPAVVGRPVVGRPGVPGGAPIAPGVRPGVPVVATPGPGRNIPGRPGPNNGIYNRGQVYPQQPGYRNVGNGGQAPIQSGGQQRDYETPLRPGNQVPQVPVEGQGGTQQQPPVDPSQNGTQYNNQGRLQNPAVVGGNRNGTQYNNQGRLQNPAVVGGNQNGTQYNNQGRLQNPAVIRGNQNPNPNAQPQQQYGNQNQAGANNNTAKPATEDIPWSDVDKSLLENGNNQNQNPNQ
jgi:hypothetical protein